jgi:serine/alanine adding enzyme
VSAVISASTQPDLSWDAFVASQPTASIYHRAGWTLLSREVFGHEVRFLEARASTGNLVGVLPLVRQKHFLLGTFATSIPFFNYGGALSESPEIGSALMQRAVDVAKEWRCSYAEFRDDQPREGSWLLRTDKVSMVMDLPEDFDVLSRKLGAKLRSQVKRAEREGAVARAGGPELLDAFYDVFCRNMRDLGTPTYPRRFFEAILHRFPKECLLLTVERSGRPAAAAFLLVDGTRAEIPWASCREDDKPLGFNMKLYWEVLSVLVSRGCTRFDLGRSSADSGTYRFKKQWGAQPLQLYWHRWEEKARNSTPQEQGRLMRHMVTAWQHLPLPVANFLGPFISPSLPW